MITQALMPLVDHLEARGYLERIPDPSDRRAKLLRITDAGRTAAATSLRIAETIESASSPPSEPTSSSILNTLCANSSPPSRPATHNRNAER
jgi:DNA-binding MarR family transcriptional regulator